MIVVWRARLHIPAVGIHQEQKVKRTKKTLIRIRLLIVIQLKIIQESARRRPVVKKNDLPPTIVRTMCIVVMVMKLWALSVGGVVLEKYFRQTSSHL